MAPPITAAGSQDQLTHKLRKPLVEKLRRERINSSIEQLKSLLGPEFLKQQPDSKLEKADVLEMTVCVLTRLQRQNRRLTRFHQNHREDHDSPPSPALQTDVDQSPVRGAPWRPW